MFKEKNKLILSLLIIILGIFLISISNFYNLETLSLKHWSKHKDDIVFVYNSLLYAEGLEQEHTDHPALFTFLIYPVFYKIFYFFGYINFYDLSSFLNEPNINVSLNKLFLISQIGTFIFCSIFTIIFFKIMKKFSVRNIDAFFITLLLFVSTGFLNQSTRIESGLLAATFLLASYFFLINFFEAENKKGYFYFMLVIILFLSSMMQKKLVYFAAPALMFSSFYFLKVCKNDLIQSKYMKKNIILFVVYFLVFLFIFLKTFRPDRYLDFLFLFINYAGVNLLLFMYVKYFKFKEYSYLLIYNLIYLAAYFSYKLILINFFGAHKDIWVISFTSFIGHLNQFSSGSTLNKIDFVALPVYFFTFLSNLQNIFIKYFFTISFQSLLIYSNIVLLSIFFKNISKNEKFSIISLLIGFIIFQTICSFRYEDPSYFIFSEFLLLLSLSILSKNFKFNFLYFFSLVIFCSVLVFSNRETISIAKMKNKGNGCHYVLGEVVVEPDNFYTGYTKRIPREKLLEFCKD